MNGRLAGTIADVLKWNRREAKLKEARTGD